MRHRALQLMKNLKACLGTYGTPCEYVHDLIIKIAIHFNGNFFSTNLVIIKYSKYTNFIIIKYGYKGTDF